MGVRTTADEALEKAQEHLRATYDHLHRIVIERCWGHDEYNDEYKAKINKLFMDVQAAVLTSMGM